jgi:hypothetical protein
VQLEFQKLAASASLILVEYKDLEYHLVAACPFSSILSFSFAFYPSSSNDTRYTLKIEKCGNL